MSDLFQQVATQNGVVPSTPAPAPTGGNATPLADPSGSATSSQTPPTQPQGTQPVTPNPNQAPTTGQPVQTLKKYAGKYESPEALEEAYNQTNKEAARMAQELAKAKRFIQQVQATQPQQPPVDPEQVSRQFLTDFAKDPTGTLTRFMGQAIAPLQEQQVSAHAAIRIKEMSSDPQNFPMFNEMKGEIADYLDQNPHIGKTSKDPIGDAYYAVMGRNIGKVVEAAKKGTLDVAAHNNQMFTQVGALTGGSGAKPPGTPEPSEADVIKAGILAAKSPVQDFLRR